MKIYPYSRQTIDEDDIRAVVDVLRSDWLTTGPSVARFEKDFARCVDAPFAVTFANGTAALHGACYAMEVGLGDEVIVPSNTFLATANAVCYQGGRPRFADIRPDTLCIDEEAIEALIGPRTRGVAPVHFGGLPADLAKIREVAARHGLFVLEDACHALGARYQGHPVGNCHFGDVAVFSFHPVKHIATGEGGMVTTSSEEVYNRLLLFRNHGMTRDKALLERNEGPWYYEMQVLGHNCRLTDFQCALGVSQLKKLSRFVETRRRLARLYRDCLAGSPHLLGFQAEPAHTESSYHLMVLRVDFEHLGLSRAEMMGVLRQQGILTQVHYIPVNSQPWYRKHFPEEVETTPKARRYYQQCLSIPLYPGLEDEDVRHIAACIRGVLENPGAEARS